MAARLMMGMVSWPTVPWHAPLGSVAPQASVHVFAASTASVVQISSCTRSPLGCFSFLCPLISGAPLPALQTKQPSRQLYMSECHQQEAPSPLSLQHVTMSRIYKQPCDGAGATQGKPRRVMANRQAAQRSRMRKLQHISDLEGSLQKLQVGLHCAAVHHAAVCGK